MKNLSKNTYIFLDLVFNISKEIPLLSFFGLSLSLKLLRVKLNLALVLCQILTMNLTVVLQLIWMSLLSLDQDCCLYWVGILYYPEILLWLHVRAIIEMFDCPILTLQICFGYVVLTINITDLIMSVCQMTLLSLLHYFLIIEEAF